MTDRIDLNCDLGEGAPHDARLMELISSANVACGRHAGDHATIARTVALARRHGVAVGAHPGFDDRANFGRAEVQLAPAELTSLVDEQIGVIETACRAAGVPLAHVKPHGAMYNMAWRDRAVADAIAAALVGRGLRLYAPSGSALAESGRAAGVRVVEEIFADRTYVTDGGLSPRSVKGAMRDDPCEAAGVVLRAIRTGRMPTIDGGDIPVRAQTVCLHGDGPNVVGFATALRSALESAGVRIAAPSEN